MLQRSVPLTLLLIGLGAHPALTQMRVVAGRVTVAHTELPVTVGKVTVAGMRIDDELRLDGVFILRVPLRQITLVASADGYRSRTVVVPANQKTVFIDLEPIAVPMANIVITGLDRGAHRTTSATRVDARDLSSSGNLNQILQGKIAGANIQQNSAVPGGDLQLRLRSLTTILGNTSPLYVLDGVVISNVAIPSGASAITKGQLPLPSRIADLNPRDIASIEVLKGAATVTMYGSKGSNGVVIIRTKRGRS